MQTGARREVLWKPASVAPGSTMQAQTPHKSMCVPATDNGTAGPTYPSPKHQEAARPLAATWTSIFQFCFCFGGPGAQGVRSGGWDGTYREIKNVRPSDPVRPRGRTVSKRSHAVGRQCTYTVMMLTRGPRFAIGSLCSRGGSVLNPCVDDSHTHMRVEQDTLGQRVLAQPTLYYQAAWGARGVSPRNTGGGLGEGRPSPR